MTGRRVTVGNHCPWTRGNIGPHRGMWTIRLIGYSSSLGDGSPVTKICTRRNPNCAYVTIRRTLDGTCFRSHHFVNSVSGQHFSAGEKQKQQNLFSTFAGAVLWRHLKDQFKIQQLARLKRFLPVIYVGPVLHVKTGAISQRIPKLIHYSDIIMTAMASQINAVTIYYSTDYLGTDKSKHQSSVSLAFVRGIHQWIPLTKGQ